MATNFSDDDLNYIQKNISKSSPESIASHLKITTKDFYLARKGLTGQELPSFFIIHRMAILGIYSKLVIFFLLYLLLSNTVFHDGKGVEQLKYIVPSATFLLSLFFLKFIFYKFTQIEQSPFDLIFISIQCFAFILSQILKQEPVFFAIAIIMLLSFIVYYLTLHVVLEKDLVLLLKFLPFATLCFFIFVINFPHLFISKTNLQLLSLISIPLLICFLIYSQKSLVTLFYGAMLGCLSAIYCLSFHFSKDIWYLLQVSIVFVGTIVLLKLFLKNQIIVNPKFYLSIVMIPIFFILTFNLFPPLSFQNPLSLQQSQSYFAQIHLYINSHFLIFVFFSSIIVAYFLWHGYRIIKDADCFSEKIFASLSLPMTISLILMLNFVTLWEELVFCLIIFGFLAGFISRQFYYYLPDDKNTRVKFKKKTDLSPKPSFALSIIILMGTLWFIVGINL